LSERWRGERETNESDYSANKQHPSALSPSKFHGFRRKSRLANPLAAQVLTFFSSGFLGEIPDLKNETKHGETGVPSEFQVYFTNERLISFLYACAILYLLSEDFES
jgi:hypothetical protein